MNNKIKEAFDQVHASEDLKQHTLDSIYQKTNGFQPRKTFYMRKYAVAMACCLLLFLGASGCYSYFTPVSAISIDINPSVELNINRFDRVINMNGYNKDGEKLADTINVRFLKYSDAIEKILSSEELKPYLIPEHLISVTVAGEDEEQNEKMLENVESATAACDEKIHCDSSASKDHPFMEKGSPEQYYMEITKQPAFLIEAPCPGEDSIPCFQQDQEYRELRKIPLEYLLSWKKERL